MLKVCFGFCFTALSDWPKKLAPPCQPIRSETRTTRDSRAHDFPRFAVSHINLLLVLIGLLDCLCRLWLASDVFLFFFYETQLKFTPLTSCFTKQVRPSIQDLGVQLTINPMAATWLSTDRLRCFVYSFWWFNLFGASFCINQPFLFDQIAHKSVKSKTYKVTIHRKKLPLAPLPPPPTAFTRG